MLPPIVPPAPPVPPPDRKSTRLNSSYITTSYAVFCLKKKNLLRRPFEREDGAIARRSPPIPNHPATARPCHHALRTHLLHFGPARPSRRRRHMPRPLP